MASVEETYTNLFLLGLFKIYLRFNKCEWSEVFIKISCRRTEKDRKSLIFMSLQFYERPDQRTREEQMIPRLL